MASGQLRYINGHSWRDPAHFLGCRICRDFRTIYSQERLEVANRRAIECARTVRALNRTRVLNISPRILRNPRIDGIIRQEEHYPVNATRQVTIQIPHLPDPVHTNYPLRDSRFRKRPATCSDNPEPAQYLVPAPIRNVPEPTQVFAPQPAQQVASDRPGPPANDPA
ncbi:hypothetical protein SAMD00023353_0204100 [Rosellinia necatrix]|uniref:Uncharacterized protein n=1 Tax=Rosellinia necatrix TaxID=77044 RepID=A0A1S8A5D5_ROSNE|nr:hypothetical protein SAMD00023353_0204100 [Rosellinia necatrix]